MTDELAWPEGPDSRPQLCVAPLEQAVTKQAWDLVQHQTRVFPKAYRVGGTPVHPVTLEDGIVVTKALSANEFRAILDSLLFCFRPGPKNEIKPCYPPQDLVAMMLNDPAAPFPVLRRIVTVPVFDRRGKLRLDPGYHADDELLLLPGDRVRKVPPCPDDQDVAEAKRLILGELLHDFPFAEDGDRTSAVALMLCPFVREMITGPTPLHFIEAPTPASGKGLLSRCLLLPSLGHRGTNWLTFPEEEEELRKQITSILMENRGAVLWDNLGRYLKSATLAKLLTDTEWSDRRLGASATVSIPVRCLWVMTGNNPTMTDELVRRVVPIRLMPDTERPEERNGFRHSDLLGWATEQRQALIWACHVLVQAWVAAGRPKPSCPHMGSFEGYRDVVGGIVEFHGFPAFLGNRSRLQVYGDPDTERWRAFVTAWAAQFGDRATATADLLPLAQAHDIPVKGASDKALVTSLGSYLAQRRQRVYAGKRLEQGTGRERRLWRAVDAVSNGHANGQNGHSDSFELELNSVTPVTPVTPDYLPTQEQSSVNIWVDESGRGGTGGARVTNGFGHSEFGPGLETDIPWPEDPHPSQMEDI